MVGHCARAAFVWLDSALLRGQVLVAIQAVLNGEGSDALVQSFYQHPSVVCATSPEEEARMCLLERIPVRVIPALLPA